VRLLLTRPEPEGERTAALLRACGHSAVIAPLLRIELVANAELGEGPWAAILVTSANAARAIAAHGRVAELFGLPVLAVGDRSAEAMREAGFAEVCSAGGGANDLTRLAAERLERAASVLYLAGADRSGDIAADLSAQNFQVRTVVIYRAVAAAVLPAAAAEALAGELDGVLHFSRRSVEAYLKLTRNAGLLHPALHKPVHFCLSARVAEPLRRAGATDIRIAAQPDEAALLALIPAP